MKQLLNVFILFFLITLIPLPITYAHLDGGVDKTINGYIIDFGFSPEQPRTTDRVTLAFNLMDATTEEVIEPTSVWIRVSSPKEVVFTGTFHPEEKHIAFTHTFLEANVYEILARFKDNGDTLVEAKFQLTVIDTISNKTKFLTGYRLTFVFGITNIISYLLVFFSCRCLIGVNFVKKMRKYKWYQKYYNLHCHYWWFFIISVILHLLFALVTFGNPF